MQNSPIWVDVLALLDGVMGFKRDYLPGNDIVVELHLTIVAQDGEEELLVSRGCG